MSCMWRYGSRFAALSMSAGNVVRRRNWPSASARSKIFLIRRYENRLFRKLFRTSPSSIVTERQRYVNFLSKHRQLHIRTAKFFRAFPALELISANHSIVGLLVLWNVSTSLFYKQFIQAECSPSESVNSKAGNKVTKLTEYAHHLATTHMFVPLSVGTGGSWNVQPVEVLRYSEYSGFSKHPTRQWKCNTFPSVFRWRSRNALQ